MKKPTISMEILSDEEFYEMKEREKKEKFLDSLLSASESSTRKMGFSVKSIRKKDEVKDRVEKKKSPPSSLSMSADSVFKKSDYRNGEFDDAKWEDLLTNFRELQSPIEVVTDDEIDNFGKGFLSKLDSSLQAENDPYVRYEKMFKKEIGMYADILKDVHNQTKSLKNRLKAMDTPSTGKTPGVSKYYNDLVEQYNSLNNTQMNVIKNMADLKAKAEDFRLKQVKADGDNGQARGVDEIVDQYYNQVMNGGRAQFMNRAFLSKSADESDRQIYEQMTSGNYDFPEGETIAKASWNITQPIPDDLGNPYETTSSAADSHGYIKNEHRQPEVCIQRFEDGRLSFIALDKDGLEVDDYELPGDDLLDSLSIKPLSNFAYDKFGRKYSIIDINTDGVDLSDLDDDDYQYGDN